MTDDLQAWMEGTMSRLSSDATASSQMQNEHPHSIAVNICKDIALHLRSLNHPATCHTPASERQIYKLKTKIMDGMHASTTMLDEFAATCSGLHDQAIEAERAENQAQRIRVVKAVTKLNNKFCTKLEEMEAHFESVEETFKELLTALHETPCWKEGLYAVRWDLDGKPTVA